MLPSNLKLNIQKTVGYNRKKKIISNTSMKIEPKTDINKVVVYHEILPATPPESGWAQGAAHDAPKIHLMKSTDKPIKDHQAAQHEQTILFTDNQKMLAKMHNDEKLAITLLIMGAGLIAYHFW